MSQIIVVIGATGGLGAAIAHAFSRLGAQLVLVGRREEELRSLAQSLTGTPSVMIADVTDADALDAISRACRDQFGRIDVVVNATGYDVRRPFLDHTFQDVNQLLDVNLMGAIWITHAFLPIMLKQTSGVILHLGGFADGRLVLPYYTVDSAARAGLRGFVDAIHREIEGSGVTVSFFCPAPADTKAERPYHHLWRAMGTSIVTPDNVAQAVVEAVRRRKRVVVMGLSTRLLAWLNNLSPTLADKLAMRHFRHLLEQFFTQRP